ncbi:MAG: DUF692 family multinuclear iron-containing protein [Myxococcota bacterium]
MGFDLPWGVPHGIVRADGRDAVDPRVARYAAAAGWASVFVSFQPRDRGELDVRDYAGVFDAFWSGVGAPARTLHHTRLNAGSPEPAEPGALADFTNALCARYGYAWVNEDLGVWRLAGRALPYPLPPPLTTAGLRACVANVRAWQAALEVPFVVEFPGFAGFTLGKLDAYDFFRGVVEETGAPCTLDVGHLLSWRLPRGLDPLDELDRLPLDRCVEIHLSGAAIVSGRFVDTHHGVLLNAQLDLLARLLPVCPNLQVVTYEDPKLDPDGALVARAAPNVERLRGMVDAWAA